PGDFATDRNSAPGERKDDRVLATVTFHELPRQRLPRLDAIAVSIHRNHWLPVFTWVTSKGAMRDGSDGILPTITLHASFAMGYVPKTKRSVATPEVDQRAARSVEGRSIMLRTS